MRRGRLLGKAPHFAAFYCVERLNLGECFTKTLAGNSHSIIREGKRNCKQMKYQQASSLLLKQNCQEIVSLYGKLYPTILYWCALRMRCQGLGTTDDGSLRRTDP